MRLRKICFVCLWMVSGWSESICAQALSTRASEIIELLQRTEVSKKLDDLLLISPDEAAQKRIYFLGIGLSKKPSASRSPSITEFEFQFVLQEKRAAALSMKSPKQGTTQNLWASSGTLTDEWVARRCSLPVSVRFNSALASEKRTIVSVNISDFNCETAKARDDEIQGDLQSQGIGGMVIKDPAYMFGTKSLPLSDTRTNADQICQKFKSAGAMRWTTKTSTELSVSLDPSSQVDRISREAQVIEIVYCNG